MPQHLRGMAGSDLGKSNTCSFHSFLLLPRELRDEIYEYILLIEQPHPPGPVSYNTSYSPPSANLSILQTSKQVYNEAARIFYGKTAFPIRISRNEARGINSDTLYYISQETPWEHLCYRFRGMNGHLYTRNTRDALVSKNYSHPNESFPSLPYGNLVRNIRVDVVDNRRFMEVMTVGSASMKLLILGTERLVHLLGTKTQQNSLNMEINVTSRILEIDADGLQALGGLLTTPDHPDLVQSARRRIYEGLIDVVWPLTRGPWKYKINVPLSLKKEFPDLLEKRLDWCSKSWSDEGQEGGIMSGQTQSRNQNICLAVAGQTPLWDLWRRQHGKLRYAGGGEKQYDPMNEDYL